MSTPLLAPEVYVKPRKRKERDLTKAVVLSPRDIFLLYGLSRSELCRLAVHEDPKMRIPSLLIPGRGRRRIGMRRYYRKDLEAWFEARRMEAAA